MDASAMQMVAVGLSGLASLGGFATLVRIGRVLERLDDHTRRIAEIERVQPQIVASISAHGERLARVEATQELAA
jgi:type II secretory pathway component PulJ